MYDFGDYFLVHIGYGLFKFTKSVHGLAPGADSVGIQTGQSDSQGCNELGQHRPKCFYTDVMADDIGKAFQFTGSSHQADLFQIFEFS